MKYFLVLSCLLVVAYGVSQEAMNKFKAELIKYGGECRGETGAGDDDISPILHKDLPKTEKAKCFVACINKKMGFQDDAGKISKEGTEAALKEVKANDEDLYTKMRKVADNCMAEVSDAANECETAANMFACVRKEEAAVGIEPMEFDL